MFSTRARYCTCTYKERVHTCSLVVQLVSFTTMPITTHVVSLDTAKSTPLSVADYSINLATPKDVVGATGMENRSP